MNVTERSSEVTRQRSNVYFMSDQWSYVGVFQCGSEGTGLSDCFMEFSLEIQRMGWLMERDEGKQG